MSGAAEPMHAVVVGGGMITHDQILPSLYHLQRRGQIGPIQVCALNSAPLRELAESHPRNAVIRNLYAIALFENGEPEAALEEAGQNVHDLLLACL